jgi:Protein of unknown function (DUF669)
MAIDLGIGFDELDRLSRPPLFSDGTYEFMIEKVESAHVQQSGRPQWRFQLKIINRPDLDNDPNYKGRSLFYYAQLPWIDPDTQQWDYTMTFGIVNMVKGIGIQVTSPNPDQTGETFYGLPREAFQGKTGPMKLSHRTRKGTEGDPEPTIDQQINIVVKRGGGGVVA